MGNDKARLIDQSGCFLGPEDLLEKGLATHSSVLGLPWWFSW